jgi:3',5'-cyclic-nucleotide phosphodiesterase
LFYTTDVVAQQTKSNFSVVPLGVKGGLDESNLSAYLIGTPNSNSYICLDAGTIRAGIDVAIKHKVFNTDASDVLKNSIKAYLISHPHLDHVAGMVMNAPADTNKNIYGLQFVIDALKEKYFTWMNWANFSDEGEKPRLNKFHYMELKELQEIKIENTEFFVTAIPLSHSSPGKSTAFLIRKEKSYLLYLGDTGPDSIEHSDKLQKLWQHISPVIRTGELKAIFIEVSFSNQQKDNQLFGHLTPRWLMRELSVLNNIAGGNLLRKVPVVITHMKPDGNEELKIKKELEQENFLKLKFVYPKQGVRIQF